jgi:hypothetical protein
VTPGVRRSIWYRYTMAWSRLRYGYHPSRALCERLTPRRAAVVDPHYARMLARTPQLEGHRGWEGAPWSEAFLAHQIRDQQVGGQLEYALSIKPSTTCTCSESLLALSHNVPESNC